MPGVVSPADTGRKLNVHNTFIRRPGRLLNVLCTFQLRPVSTGTPLLMLTCTRNNQGEPRFLWDGLHCAYWWNNWTKSFLRFMGFSDIVKCSFNFWVKQQKQKPPEFSATQFIYVPISCEIFGISLYKKWRFSLVNVTKFTLPCGFGHIYWRNP